MLYKRRKYRKRKKYFRNHFSELRRNEQVARRRYKRSSSVQCKSCGLLLVADPSFFRDIGERSVKQTVLQMLYHIRESNLLLGRFDYDGDSNPDCVGVHVSGVGVLASDDSDYNLLAGNFTTSEQYLRAFSKYQFDQHCLAVLFSSKVDITWIHVYIHVYYTFQGVLWEGSGFVVERRCREGGRDLSEESQCWLRDRPGYVQPQQFVHHTEHEEDATYSPEDGGAEPRTRAPAQLWRSP